MAGRPAPGARELDVGHIERLMPAGPILAVIDLFPRTGNVGVGAVIHDFHAAYRVVMVLVFETPGAGARVLAERRAGPDDRGEVSGGLY